MKNRMKMVLSIGVVLAVMLLLGTAFSGSVYAKVPERLDTVGNGTGNTYKILNLKYKVFKDGLFSHYVYVESWMNGDVGICEYTYQWEKHKLIIREYFNPITGMQIPNGDHYVWWYFPSESYGKRKNIHIGPIDVEKIVKNGEEKILLGSKSRLLVDSNGLVIYGSYNYGGHVWSTHLIKIHKSLIIKKNMISSSVNKYSSSTYSTYSPPYWFGYEGTYKTGWGANNRYASYSFNKYNGYMWEKAGSFSIVGGSGRADAWAGIVGPQNGKFSVSHTGTYKISFYFTVNGVAQTSCSLPWWGGAASASGLIKISSWVYEKSTGYLVGSKSHVLYNVQLDFPWVSHAQWNNYHLTITIENTLYAGHYYYFQCELYARHISAALGGADAGSNSNVNAYLTSVNVEEV